MNCLTLKDICEKCDIKCLKCLDTGKAWLPRKHWTAQLDGGGAFDLFRCPDCSDGHWYSCSHSSDIYEGGIKVFNLGDNNEGPRIAALKDILYKIEQKEKEVKEYLNNQRIENENRERERKEREEREERERKERERLENERIENDKRKKQEEAQRFAKQNKEDIEKQMNDGSDKPLYGESLEDTFSSTTEKLHIQAEIGKLLDKVSNSIKAYGGDLMSLASLVKDIKIDMDMKSEEENTEKTKCCQSTIEKGYPVYLFLKVLINKELSSCNLLEWCGYSKLSSKITMKYMILFPKNNVAKKECDDGISTITGVKLQNIVAFLTK